MSKQRPGDRGRGRGPKPPASRSERAKPGASRSEGPKSPKGGRSGPARGGASRSGGARGGKPRGPKRSAAAKRGLGGDQIEGRQAVRELLLAGSRRAREIYLIEDLDQADIIEDITELAFEANVPVRQVSRRHFDTEALTESHQGVLARADVVAEHNLDDLAQVPRAFLLVLDGITDPGNLGAILRTAECAGVTGVVLPKHRSVHLSPTVTKAAAGAIEHLPMAVVGGIPTAINQLRDLGVFTIGLEAGGTSTIFDLPLEADVPVALVLGAEGRGLGRLVQERVDALAAIPLAGRLNSLNVAMAGAVACFEIVRRRSAT